jgi:hypothetical protein
MAERPRLQRADGEFAVQLAAQASALSDPTRLTIATALLLAAVRRQRGNRVSTFERPLVHQAPIEQRLRAAQRVVAAGRAPGEAPCLGQPDVG